MYIAASQNEREITISKVEIDIDTYKINNKPTWVSDPEYTHSILQKLKNLHDNIKKELNTLEFDTIDIRHEDDPLFSFLINHGRNHFRVEAWSNICNN